MSNERSGEDNDKNNDASVAKTAGFVVFSGIAMSILKALNPYNKPKLPNTDEHKPIAEPNQSTIQQCHSLSPQEPIIKDISQKPIACVEKNLPESSPRTVDIVRGDTLWGLSRKYGVSIDAIKEANGLAGDTIYAGKKLIIP